MIKKDCLITVVNIFDKFKIRIFIYKIFSSFINNSKQTKNIQTKYFGINDMLVQ